MPGITPSGSTGSHPTTTPPSTKVPPPPSYVGAAVPSTTPSQTQQTTTLWNLGALYNQPIFLGSEPGATPFINVDNDRTPYKGALPAKAEFGKTQDLEKQIMQMWAAQSAEKKANPNSLTSYEQIQQALWAAGFYGQTAFKDIHVGQWTTQTQAALTNALTSYEQVTQGGTLPVTFGDFLNQNGQGGADGGFGSGGGSTTPQVQLADPVALRAAAQSAAQAALGKGLSKAQLDKFVSQFQSLQTADQTSTAASATTPEVSSEATAFAEQQDPAAYQQHQQDSYLNALVNMFLPSSSARPNMTPVASA